MKRKKGNGLSSYSSGSCLKAVSTVAAITTPLLCFGMLVLSFFYFFRQHCFLLLLLYFDVSISLIIKPHAAFLIGIHKLFFVDHLAQRLSSADKLYINFNFKFQQSNPLNVLIFCLCFAKL